MDLLREWMAPYMVEWLIGIALIQLFLLVAIAINGLKFHKIRKQQKQLLRGLTRGNMEQLLHKYNESLKETEAQLDEVVMQLNELKERIPSIKGNVGIVKYNALAEQGNDLSFSMAILDQHQNGVVLSSLYGRHQSYCYAKPLTKGKSEYSLSEEERAAIAEAIAKKEVETM